ncbi:MAG TPA: hypothetical protein VIG64_02465 [Actinomycetota bacterium]
MRTIEDLLAFTLANPSVGRALQEDPQTVAKVFDIELTEEDASQIQANLNVDELAAAAETADTMAQKVAQGIGLIRGESSR